MRWIMILALLAGCEQPEKKAPTPPIVGEGSAIVKTVPYVLRTVGNVHTINQVDVMPQIMGQLTGIYVDDGAVVKEGDLLVSIDPRIYQASLKEAEGEYQQSTASLSFNQERVRRYAELLPEDFVSVLDFEQYVSNEGVAAGQVEQFEGSVNKAKVNLDFCWIRAPMDGKCGIVFPTVGDIMSPEESQPIVVINQISPIYVNFTVAERFFPLLMKYQTKEGLRVIAKAQDETFEGVLTFIDNTMNKTTGTIEMRATFANKEEKLWPGLFVDVTVVLYEISNAVLAPSRAVNINTKGHFVYVIESDGTVEQVQVEVGQTHGTYTVINSGLKGGEKLVTSGQFALGPGVKVRTDESV